MQNLPTSGSGEHEHREHDDEHGKKSPSSTSQDNPPDSTDKKTGRRKINIEFIEDKSRRHITFSKRKAGIMKKAYELSTLTGTQVLLLVASETGHVYTFATPKLQPLITKPEGKNLIQTCLNAPDAPASSSSNVPAPRLSAPAQDAGLGIYGDGLPTDSVYDDDKHKQESKYAAAGLDMAFPGGGFGPYGQYPMPAAAMGMPMRQAYPQMQGYGGSSPSYAQNPYASPAAYGGMWPGAGGVPSPQSKPASTPLGAASMQSLPLGLSSAPGQSAGQQMGMQKQM
jgi:hypothetical protein